MRVFAALEPDEAARERLTAVPRRFERSPGILDDLRAALAAVEPPAGPIDLALTGLGFLPDERAPRIFLAGVRTPPELAAFQQRVEAAAQALGLPAERRAYLAHVTLGRIRDPRQAHRLVDAAGEFREELGAMRAGSWTLFESELRPSGARYRAVARWPFAEPSLGGLREAESAR